MCLRRQYLCIYDGIWKKQTKEYEFEEQEKKFHMIFFKEFYRLKQGNFEMLCYSEIKCTVEIRMCYIKIKSYSERSSCKIRFFCGVGKRQCSENPLGEANS